ncbi:hypothetical protein OGAPHI_002099 [Ogataea philodendri]|uniref:Polynucleotide 5'-hydroxyl-kinase GRC3 n=1 Tax=Ogataea philodendri TaxID=1378263 RepID=A0A9P8T7M9_9ASCO|nr:uncharacterized protein OGAPHI_002099 [Ogataea philodendri]KAH3668345.1 hypothetical protein OGAPHI_002099 [Ogataea philodendri]
MSRSSISAFAALSTVDDDDDELIRYEQSDEETQTAVADVGQQEVPVAQPYVPAVSAATNASVVINCSRFTPTAQNVIYGSDYVIVGLNAGEFLMVKGQYSLKIQRGAVQIDSVLYHSSQEPIQIHALPISSIPIISAAQVTDHSLVEDTISPENEHLFSSEYKSVVRIDNVFDGLEKLGLLYPQLKNIHPNREDNDEFVGSEFEKSFYSYSFRLLHTPSNNLGTYINKDWKSALNGLVEDAEASQSIRVLVIGGKNTGKSTFLRLLLDQILSRELGITKLLDIDPGQPEYSLPDSISLTSHENPIHGVYFPFTRKTTTEARFIGFNSPQRQPLQYISQLKQLAEQVNMDSDLLLINSPGWIKGFGIEILKELTATVNPTHLVYLSHGRDDDNELLNSLKYEKLVFVPAFTSRGYDIVRYSPTQIRNFRFLSYFHYNYQEKRFDFEPLLAKSPYKVSYIDTGKRDKILSFSGLTGVFFLDSANINQQDLIECLETQIVAIFELEYDEFQNYYDEMSARGQIDSLEPYPNLFRGSLDPATAIFRGLALIHSIDTENKFINLYTPIKISNLVASLAANETKLILAKGRSEMPWEEIVPKMVSKSRLPYVSYTSSGKGAKSVNVRRNIQRKK